MLEISINWYQGSDPEGSFQFLHDCGFEGIDFGMGAFLSPKKLAAGEDFPFFRQEIGDILAYYEPMREAAIRHGMKICQAHAPFPLYFEGREDLNDFFIEVVNKCCAICQYLGCPYLVVHPYRHADKDFERQISLEMFRRMIPAARAYGIKILLENLYIMNANRRLIEGVCSDVGEACWYVDTLNEEAGEELFGFCLDIGHANMFGCNIRAYVKGLGKRLTTLHIHDNMGIKDSHLIPYTQDLSGGVDWEDVVEGLRESGYEGPISFEISRGIDYLPESVRPEGMKLISAIGRSFKERIQVK